MQSDKERIEQIILSKKLNNIEFSNKTLLSPSTLSHILSERTKPTLTILRNIVEAFPDLNPMWVLLGQGEMYLADENAKSSDNQDETGADDDIDDILGPMKNGLGYVPKPKSGNQQQSTISQPASIGKNQSTPQVPSLTIKDVEDVMTKTVAQLQKPARQVTEVRIFFDDGTYECFYTKK